MQSIHQHCIYLSVQPVKRNSSHPLTCCSIPRVHRYSRTCHKLGNLILDVSFPVSWLLYNQTEYRGLKKNKIHKIYVVSDIVIKWRGKVNATYICITLFNIDVFEFPDDYMYNSIMDFVLGEHVVTKFQKTLIRYEFFWLSIDITCSGS